MLAERWLSLVRRAGLAALVLVGVVAAVVRFGPTPGVDHYAHVADASELVPRNDVRVDDVVVGEVTAVELEGAVARVEFRVEPDLEVTADSELVLRQASLLGESFLDLVPGEGQVLQDGEGLPLGATRRAADLEVVVGEGAHLAASLTADSMNTLIGAFDTAVAEQPEVLEGLLDDAGDAAETFTGAGDDLEATIDGVADLTAEYEPRSERMAESLDDLGRGLAVLADEGDELERFTAGLSELSVAVTGILEDNEERLMGFGGQLTQVLGEIVAVDEELGRGIDVLYDFNASWACIGDGNFINQTFVLAPELATVDSGAQHCDPDQGPRSRANDGQVRVLDGYRMRTGGSRPDTEGRR
jgi:phospholipid/cholesterol/gamma-HCH transport system substrate-binding protein